VVAKVVREYGAKAQERLARFGGSDREAIGVNIAMWAHQFRKLGEQNLITKLSKADI
jgi:hypothetical protein